MVETFVSGIRKHQRSKDVHVSCDTAIARGVGESRLELLPMINWDAFIGSRQLHELHLHPRQRHYHRYLPFPPSICQLLDEWAREKIKLSLHHQLLTGVVIYIDPREFESTELDELESSVVRKEVALLAPGHYWRNKFNVTSVTVNDDRSLVERLFDQIWEAQRGSCVMALYYQLPKTFSCEHYVPTGVERFLFYIQNHRCPCQDRCDLSRVSSAIDHILPKKQYGTNMLINLQATCRDYNSGRKGARPEPRTVNYPNVMRDPRWRPLVSSAYQELLLDQRCNEAVLREIERLNAGRVARSFEN